MLIKGWPCVCVVKYSRLALDIRLFLFWHLHASTDLNTEKVVVVIGVSFMCKAINPAR